jgi:hypothetical protein
MQEQICCTLAHFVIYLGPHIGLNFSRDAELSILTSAPADWQEFGRITVAEGAEGRSIIGGVGSKTHNHQPQIYLW